MHSFSQAKIDRKNAELNRENAQYQQVMNSSSWKTEEEIKGDGDSAIRTKTHNEQNMDFTECTICRVAFDENEMYPMVLSCGHTYCWGCIDKF